MFENKRGAISVLGGFLTHLVCGAFYLWGNISINVTSYYRYHGYPDIETKTVSAVFPSIYFGISIGTFLGIGLARRFGHKTVSLVNMILYCGSQYIATFCGFWLFVVFMGFLPGVFIGIEYLIPVDNALQFYPKRLHGLISGLILCGFGFGAVIFNPLLQYFANPENIGTVLIDGEKYYPVEVADLLPSALLKITSVYLILGIVGVVMMMGKDQSKIDATVNSEDTLIENEECEIEVNSWWDILKTKEVYISCTQIFCLTGFGFLMASHYKEYGIQYISDDSFFSIIGAVGGLSNGLSRFAWSYALDFVDDKKLVLVNIAMAMVLAGTIQFIAQNQYLFMLWIIFTYFQYGGIYTLFPGIANKQYGKKWGAAAFGCSYVFLPLSNLLQFLMTLYLHQAFMDGTIFYVYVGINGAALIMQLFLLKNDRKQD